jgi:LytS/YehU family sensor histidine kinase
MEKEAQMKENELSMEAHLKEAQLKFLQAQINPHFLFNSLNAGSQLAMMESADRTEHFLSRMAQFFRYNVKKTGGDAALSEEIASVDNYFYILNVRFSGDIHYEKQIDETVDLEQMRMPSMILQPIVENAIQHGIHDDHENGIVTLAVDPVPENENESGTDCVRITVSDNGTGMTRKQIEAIMDRSGIEAHSPDEEEKDSTGIAMENVISRLELYYNRKNLFSIWSDGPGTGTEVTVLLPMEPDTVRKNGSEGRSGSDYGTDIRPDLVRKKLSSIEEKEYVSDSDS